MSVYYEVEAVYDRGIEADGTLPAFEALLRDEAGTWTEELRTYDGPRDQEPVEPGALDRAVPAAALARGEAYRALAAQHGEPGTDRRHGSIELRGAGPVLNVVVSIDSEPFAPTGGKTLMGNGIGVFISRARVEGRPALEWATAALERLAAETSPAWGAVHAPDEYQAKVMRDGPGAEALGRDFARFLPGLFGVNFFGAPYVELLGRDRLLDAPNGEARPVGDGVLVVLDGKRDDEARRADEQAWLEHLGPEHFFVKGQDGDRATRAPDWGQRANTDGSRPKANSSP